MKNAQSADRRQNFQHTPARLSLSVIRCVDEFASHDPGAYKLLSDNRELYMRQSRETRGGIVPLILSEARAYELDAMTPELAC